MDVNEYIASGILEIYAAGALSQAEMKEVEDMVSKHPEVAQELKKISDALAGYASSFGRNPRPALRKEVMEKTSGAVRSQGNHSEQQKNSQASSTLAYKYLLAACLASLVISTFASYFFYNRWSDTEDKNILLLSEKNGLNQNYTEIKNSFDKTFEDVLVMRDPNSKVYNLIPVDTSRHFAARVYWNDYSHEAFLDILSLPPADSGKIYQLWTVVGGKPVDAGVFSVTDESNLQHMKSVYASDSWAVTVEPSGGSVNPTLTTMCMASKK
jgi:anti-sigma-K factor RskA